MSDWTGTPLLRTLDELAAFDAMRAFLETWWEVGGRAENNIVSVLSACNRTHGLDSRASQGAPIDPAMWADWRNAVETVLTKGSAPNKDPLADGG